MTRPTARRLRSARVTFRDIEAAGGWCFLPSSHRLWPASPMGMHYIIRIVAGDLGSELGDGGDGSSSLVLARPTEMESLLRHDGGRGISPSRKRPAPVRYPSITLVDETDGQHHDYFRQRQSYEVHSAQLTGVKDATHSETSLRFC